MRTLIAVLSYIPDRNKGCHDAIRKGWGQKTSVAGVDLKFFIATNGLVIQPLPDEVCLNISDAYDRISYESLEILKWSIRHGYDFTYLACNDTFVNVDRLTVSGFEKYDYFGVFYSPSYPKEIAPGEQADFKCYDKILPGMYLWMDGGIGYTVSKKAAELIISQDPVSLTSDVHHGQILGPYFKTGNIVIGRMGSDVSQHYRHVPSEPRYAGVLQWQKDMYENEEFSKAYPRGTW